MLSAPNRLAVGLLRLLMRLVVRIVRLLVKFAGAAILATIVVFVLDLLLLGDKRRKAEQPRPQS